MTSLETWHSMFLRSLNLGLIGLGRKSSSVAHPAPSLSMLSLDAGVLRGEERLGERVFGLPLSVDMLTTSWEVLAGTVEPDLAGGVGIVAPLGFFPAGTGGVMVLVRLLFLDRPFLGLVIGIT